MRYKLGIIGLGVMGEAILNRILAEKKLSAEDIAVFDLDIDKVKKFPYKVNIESETKSLVNNSDRVLLAIKPQHYITACQDVCFDNVTTLYSIMAGVRTRVLREKLNLTNTGIVRIMPNVPCKLGKGVCGVTYSDVVDAEKIFAENLLSSCGGMVITDEDNFDAITSVSGSGPAYLYTFAQGMIEGGINGGLSYEESKLLALDTIIGAAEIAKSSSEPLSVLVDRVCSKGGTTIEAINVFHKKNLIGIVAEGVDACRKKSKELSEKL